MSASVKSAVPILPAASTADSLEWWTRICGFAEMFRDGTPPTYAGIAREGVHLHLSGMSDAGLARTVGEQTMVRIVIENVEAMHAEFQERGGAVHPNGPLQAKPWGTTEFAAIDPNGVCVTFQG